MIVLELFEKGSEQLTVSRYIFLVIFPLAFLYTALYMGSISVASTSEAIAMTAGLLLGISFALSGFSYFFDFLDHALAYRKYLGVIGMYLAWLYCFTLQYRFPDKYFWGLWDNITDPEVLLGLGAMTILTYMRFNGAKVGMKLAGSWWRPIFRLGYIAYLMLIIRAVLIEQDMWTQWLTTSDILPPPRLVLTIFASFVIMLRIVMEVSIRFHQLFDQTKKST